MHRAAIESAKGSSSLSAHCFVSMGMTLAIQDRDQAIDAFVTALEHDPRHVGAHLQLAALLLAANEPTRAAEHYHVSFTINPELESAPRNPAAPKPLAQAASQGLRHLRGHFMGLHRDVVAALEEQHGADALRRARACMEIQHGQRTPEWAHPMQKPAAVYVPGLPARPWYERDEIEGIDILEAAYTDIRQELEELLARPGEGFAPYVHAGPNVPPEMQNLAGKKDWNAFHLYKDGKRIEENCARCPKTLEAVEQMSMPRCEGNAPEVFFSLLKPGTHIQPHHGVANSKLAVHLALTIPPDCALRSGPETRSWVEGQCLIFDDSFEHEAWNRSDALRAVLILEVWNPLLSDVEREALSALCNAIERWARPVVDRWLG